MHNINKLLIAFVVLLGACKEKQINEGSSTTTPEDQVILTAAQFNSIGIQLGKLESRAVSSTIKANGMLDVPPQNFVTVSAILGGFVKETKLLQGMKVSHGQVIAVMQDPAYIQLQQDYLQSKSQLEFYESEFKRQQELAKENINAAKTLQQAQSNFLSATANVEGLKEKLKLINIPLSKLEDGDIQSEINIYSPINGYVTQVNVNIGMHVNPTDVLFKIVDTKHLHAEIIVYEKDISKIKIDQRVRIQLSNESAERIARVYLIGKAISLERTISVHCHLEKEDDALLPGMYLSALFETSIGNVPTLPEEAVVNFEGSDYAFMATNQDQLEYQMIKITKGVSALGYVQVTLPEDVEPNSSFVVKGAYDLLGYLKNTEEE